MTDKINGGIIVAGAIKNLEDGLAIIKERDKSYNGNGICFEDFKLNGMESTWDDILECFVRCWNTGGGDSKVDWTVYGALQSELVANGIPQSRFSPIFRRFVPRIWQALKERDAASPDCRIIDVSGLYHKP